MQSDYGAHIIIFAVFFRFNLICKLSGANLMTYIRATLPEMNSARTKNDNNKKKRREIWKYDSVNWRKALIFSKRIRTRTGSREWGGKNSPQGATVTGCVVLGSPEGGRLIDHNKYYCSLNAECFFFTRNGFHRQYYLRVCDCLNLCQRMSTTPCRTVVPYNNIWHAGNKTSV